MNSFIHSSLHSFVYLFILSIQGIYLAASYLLIKFVVGKHGDWHPLKLLGVCTAIFYFFRGATFNLDLYTFFYKTSCFLRICNPHLNSNLWFLFTTSRSFLNSVHFTRQTFVTTVLKCISQITCTLNIFISNVLTWLYLNIIQIPTFF